MVRAVNVAYWHFADKTTAPEFVAYWGNSGHWPTRTLDGWVANDPTQTFPLTAIPKTSMAEGHR